MQIVVLILCITAVLLWCVLAFVRRRGEHPVPVLIMDVVVTLVVLGAVITGLLGYGSAETEGSPEAKVQAETQIKEQTEVQPKAQMEKQTEAQTKAQMEKQTQAQTKAQVKEQTQAQTKTQADSSVKQK